MIIKKGIKELVDMLGGNVRDPNTGTILTEVDIRFILKYLADDLLATGRD